VRKGVATSIYSYAYESTKVHPIMTPPKGRHATVHKSFLVKYKTMKSDKNSKSDDAFDSWASVFAANPHEGE